MQPTKLYTSQYKGFTLQALLRRPMLVCAFCIQMAVNKKAYKWRIYKMIPYTVDMGKNSYYRDPPDRPPARPAPGVNAASSPDRPALNATFRVKGSRKKGAERSTLLLGCQAHPRTLWIPKSCGSVFGTDK